MEQIGTLNDRDIFYISVRRDTNWFEKLPNNKWLAFTIANEIDRELLIASIPKCLDKSVLYICSSGQLGSLSHDFFDEEIIARAVQKETLTERSYDHSGSPMTTGQNNITEEFWFAIYTAYDEDATINKIICLDFTTEKVKEELIELIGKMREGWLPSDEDAISN